MRPPTLESRTVASASAVVESAHATDRPPGGPSREMRAPACVSAATYATCSLSKTPSELRKFGRECRSWHDSRIELRGKYRRTLR